MSVLFVCLVAGEMSSGEKFDKYDRSHVDHSGVLVVEPLDVHNGRSLLRYDDTRIRVDFLCRTLPAILFLMSLYSE